MRISDWSSDVCCSDLPYPRQWQYRQRDQQHVQRKQPARDAQMALVLAFDHTDMKLVGQGEDRQHAKHHQRGEAVRVADRWRRHARNPIQPKRNKCSERQHGRSEEHTSELQSLMRISYAVSCSKKKISHIINLSKS